MLSPENSQQDAMLHQAIKFIGEEQYPKAKELLTGLLQTDQNNATYWVWLSAAMETQKERLYCLQMAYKVDPTNLAAQRGLILLGALNPDETQAPFPMNHPRLWERRLRMEEEKDKPKGIKRVTSNPVFRLVAISVLAIGLFGGAVFGIGAFITSRQAEIVDLNTPTSRPTVTPQVKKVATADSTLVPLSDLLKDGTFTPTPIYAMTPHGDAALDAYRAALKAYNQKQWDQMAVMMVQIATSQPGSVDAIYFIAEGKRLSGQYEDALDYYKQAIAINAKYAPSYLGQARAKLGISAGREVMTDFNKAIQLDPNFVEAYLDRGLYSLRKQNLSAARTDIEKAAALAPESPLIQYNLAQILLTAGENKAALEAAQKAKDLDVTSLDSYLLLGMAANANGEIDRAVEALDIYTKYVPTNGDAYAILGEAYFKRDENDKALENIEQAIKLNPNSSAAYLWRGEIFLKQGDGEKALADFRRSNRINVTFSAGMGIARSILQKTDPKGDPKKVSEAYAEAFFSINEVEKLLKTDQQKAIFYYYKATVLEKLEQPIPASRTWEFLVKLPEGATTDEIREEAKSRIVALQSATPPPPTKRPTATLRVTVTPKASATLRTTRTPTITPTPTK